MSTRIPDGVITFAEGLPGFEKSRQFVVVASPSLEPFACLHGVEPAAPSFLVLDPRRVISDYTCSLEVADRARLNVASESRLLWLALVTPTDDGATLNLRAPLVINPETMQGVQVVSADSPYSIAHPLGA
ncbi:MAG TPA: flagellar assembly protein FliW [Vicinamibacterales bacterium]|nr:flagellar assembly protein FliW [Vicinamibacterales bacterium]